MSPGSSDSKAHLWTNLFTKYGSTAGLMFLKDSKDGAGSTSYTYDSRFENLSCRLLFSLASKILDTLKHIGLYKYTLRIGTDHVLMALVLHRCGEVDPWKTAVNIGPVSCEFQVAKSLAWRWR